jgi:outer membrane biogenesis lipoprotein LolB
VWCTLAAVAYWLYVRWNTDGKLHGNTDTLHNPTKLHDTLSSFLCPPQSVIYNNNNGRHKTEQMCRRLLERMIGLDLPKVRPKWLVNPSTKRSLELDMYNHEAKLAFEYDGAQHNVFTPHFHANEYHFEYRRLLDKLKSELCKEAGVTLIRIVRRLF